MLQRLRPRFRTPRKISSVWWPKYVRTPADSGGRDRILRRSGSCGYPQIADPSRHAYREIQGKERAEVLNAITGAGYQCLWERAG